MKKATKQTIQLFSGTSMWIYENINVVDWGLKYVVFSITREDGTIQKFTSTLPFLIITESAP
jgi:hypothetical protein